MQPDILKTALAKQPYLVLDGGLASELVNAGYDLRHPLWTGKILSECPEAIRKTHLDYLHAGANIIITSSYQLSFIRNPASGFSPREIEKLLKKSVVVAKDVVAEYLNAFGNHPLTIKPMVAASLGSYGACLADGSEYCGRFGLSIRELAEFHKPRIAALIESNPDLIAFETLPDARETEALASLIQSNPYPCWFTFSCADEKTIHDGTSIRDVVSIASSCSATLAAGINCTPPSLITSLIHEIRPSLNGREIVVYPNSGETWNHTKHSWSMGKEQESDFPAETWFEAGARLVGGCCRTGPAEIAEIKKTLSRISQSAPDSPSIN